MAPPYEVLLHDKPELGVLVQISSDFSVERSEEAALQGESVECVTREGKLRLAGRGPSGAVIQWVVPSPARLAGPTCRTERCV